MSHVCVGRSLLAEGMLIRLTIRRVRCFRVGSPPQSMRPRGLSRFGIARTLLMVRNNSLTKLPCWSNCQDIYEVTRPATTMFITARPFLLTTPSRRLVCGAMAFVVEQDPKVPSHVWVLGEAGVRHAAILSFRLGNRLPCRPSTYGYEVWTCVIY